MDGFRIRIVLLYERLHQWRSNSSPGAVALIREQRCEEGLTSRSGQHTSEKAWAVTGVLQRPRVTR